MVAIALLPLISFGLLHKSEKGEAFAPEFIGKIRVFIRKCFAPTAKNRFLQEVYSTSTTDSFAEVG
jgi:hypothetical protein